MCLMLLNETGYGDTFCELLFVLSSENPQNSLLILPDVLVILILGLYDFLRSGPEKDTEKKSCYVLEMYGEAQRTAAGDEKPVTGFRYACNNCKNQKKRAKITNSRLAWAP